jgi:hypothetical protein
VVIVPFWLLVLWIVLCVIAAEVFGPLGLLVTLSVTLLLCKEAKDEGTVINE